MPKYYSPSFNGFYTEDIHGPREIEHFETDPDTGETLDRYMVANPDCLIPADAVEITAELYASLFEAQAVGKIIQADARGRPVAVDPAPPSVEQVIKGYTRAVQAHVDALALARGYDSAASAISYADEPAVQRYMQEGRAFRAWRSKVWEHCTTVLARVQAGEAAMPMQADLIASLPEITGLPS